MGVVCDLNEARLVIERYDADRDGKLGFWEFANSLLPIDTLARDDLERRRAVWDISYETKELLRRVFRRIIDTESMLESIRQRIGRDPEINLRSAFDAMDWLRRGFITSAEFKRSFDDHTRETGFAASASGTFLREDSVEVEGLIRRFNKDKMNGRISLPEFMEELSVKTI